MDNFRIIYKILKILEKAMSVDEFDPQMISPEQLKINENLWRSLMIMLIENGYVKGAVVVKSVMSTGVNVEQIQITLKGLEYLNDNTFMKRAARAAKGFKEIKGIID